MFQRILVAIDQSPSSAVALSYVSALAGGDPVAVHVVHVNRFMVGGPGCTELSGAEALALVQDGIEQLRQQGIAATGSVARANCFSIGQVVADEALARRCDVIVLGSRRRRSGLGAMGGGTRERITRHSTLPILTAPSPLLVPGSRLRRTGTAVANRRRPTSVDH